MATQLPLHHTTRAHLDDGMTPKAALNRAWVIWIVMLSLPFFIFLYDVWTLMNDGGTPRNLRLGQIWFIISMAYLALAVPLAFFWRSHYFRAYWQGEAVSPRAYLMGMLCLWLTIETGGLFSLFGCLISHSLLPHLLPALVAFVLFVPMWPSGRAMTQHSGNADDPERYEEPR